MTEHTCTKQREARAEISDLLTALRGWHEGNEYSLGSGPEGISITIAGDSDQLSTTARALAADLRQHGVVIGPRARRWQDSAGGGHLAIKVLMDLRSE